MPSKVWKLNYTRGWTVIRWLWPQKEMLKVSCLREWPFVGSHELWSSAKAPCAPGAAERLSERAASRADWMPLWSIAEAVSWILSAIPLVGLIPPVVILIPVSPMLRSLLMTCSFPFISAVSWLLGPPRISLVPIELSAKFPWHQGVSEKKHLKVQTQA